MRSTNIYDVIPCLRKREWLTWVALVQSLLQMQQAAGCDYGHLKTGLDLLVVGPSSLQGLRRSSLPRRHLHRLGEHPYNMAIAFLETA